jgi:hypothetical protein
MVRSTLKTLLVLLTNKAVHLIARMNCLVQSEKLVFGITGMQKNQVVTPVHTKYLSRYIMGIYLMSFSFTFQLQIIKMRSKIWTPG